MSSKGTNGKISYRQYRLADHFLFLLIMVVFEIINVLAIRRWFTGQLFSISLMFTVSLIVLVRWNWWAAIFPIADGILYCWLNGAAFQSYVVYAVGNAFLLLSWFLFKAIPKKKLFSRWYLSLIYPLVAFVLVLLGRTIVAVCFGESFFTFLYSTFFTEVLNIFFAVVAILILRRFDSMLRDQKEYLFEVARNNEELKRPKEDVWEGYTELDEEELKKLRHKKTPVVMPQDEYPPDSR
jgi:hypothetical protein